MKIEAIEYANGKKKVTETTPKELQKLLSNKYDLVWNELYAEFRITNQDGEIIEHCGSIKKIGITRLMFLKVLLENPAMFLNHFQIGKFSERYLDSDDKRTRWAINSLYVKQSIITSVHLLKSELFRYFSDYFIMTCRSPYSVAFNKDRSFLWIRPKRSES